MAATKKAIVVKELHVAFDTAPVLRGLDLELEQGERVAVLGPNGSGKTTLLRTLASLVRPQHGTVLVAGADIQSEPNLVRQSVGYVGHQSLLYNQLTVEENLRFYGRLYRVEGLKERIAEVLEMVSMGHRRADLAGTLSHGQQRRISIARALLHRPSVLLLDESDSGLDAEGLEMFKEIVTGGGRSVLLTTHNPERGLPLVHRALSLSGGRLVETAMVVGNAEGDRREDVLGTYTRAV